MFGETDLINDLAKKCLMDWCTIQLLCNAHVTFGWFQFGEIVFICQIRQTFPRQTFPPYGIINAGIMRQQKFCPDKQQYNNVKPFPAYVLTIEEVQKTIMELFTFRYSLM